MTRKSPSQMFRRAGSAWVRRLRKYVLAGEQNWRCAYCCCVLTFENVTVDHVVPLSVTRTRASWENEVAACVDCNRQKKDKDAQEFFNWKRQARIKNCAR